MIYSTFFKTMTSVWLLTGAFACSHLPVEEIPITADPSNEIEELSAALTEAKEQQVDVLSPSYYEKTADALQEAKASRSKSKDSRQILDKVAIGLANLKKANEVAMISRPTLGKVVKARADALTANAPKLVEDRFKAADKRLIDATKRIEDDDLSTAQNAQSELVRQYADIELSAIKINKLSGIWAKIKKAEDEGAKEAASRSYSDTLQTLKMADAFISANRHDVAGIDSRVDVATEKADHLLDVARQVKVADKVDAESMVLAREAQQKRMNLEVAAGKAKTAKLADASAASDNLEAQNAELGEAQAADERLDLAKAQFSSQEAEVYRDGNRLVIRMKTIAFPSGKATLAAENFPLLGKVQRVISELDASHVTVQGHTDAVGSPLANEKLSNERASAIGGYLTANGFAAANITTEGFGDRKPLASNRTEEGRAQNRRVDIIIDPKRF